MLIINADDWGRDTNATDTTLACCEAGSLSSTSAMVFLADSQRAAGLAKSAGIRVGLHINFTLAFDPGHCPPEVCRRQNRIRRFLTRSKYALVLYNPFLRQDFRFVFDTQLAEFERLYGQPPSHFDGHQHMHLATNMLVQKIIPAGVRVRRSFSFWPGRKSAVNRGYRRMVDRCLARRYRLGDFFFALSDNLVPARLQQIFDLAEKAEVELMTHAWNEAEYRWLINAALRATPGGGFAMPSRNAQVAAQLSV